MAGVASVGSLIWVTGTDTLLEPLWSLSWPIVMVLIVVDGTVMAIDTLAWRVAFLETPVPLRRLFSVRLAGEALNLAIASVGGEPVKVYLLQPAVPIVEASTAQFIDKTSITAGQVLFLALGLAAAVSLFDVPAGVLQAMGALLLVQIAVVVMFVLAQVAGILRWTVRLSGWFGVRDAAARWPALRLVDHALVTSYRERRGRVIACVAIHLLAWAVGSLEVYLLLAWLGLDASFAGAFAIHAFGTGVKFMAFAVPSALGVLEGGYMLAFGVMGFGSGLGLSFTLLRRLRLVAWGALGLAVLVTHRRRVAARSPARRGASAP